MTYKTIQLNEFLVNTLTQVEGVEYTVRTHLCLAVIDFWKEKAPSPEFSGFGKLSEWGEDTVTIEVFECESGNVEEAFKTLNSMDVFLTFFNFIPDEDKPEAVDKLVDLLVDIIAEGL